MSFTVRFTPQAREDLERLYRFLAENDVASAERALNSIENALGLLEEFPFTCRKAVSELPLLRELVIPFGAAGYVALFEIEQADTVTVLAVRSQREDDYY